MELLFHLSGEHQTLPRSEVLSFLKYRGWEPRLIKNVDQLVVCGVDGPDPRQMQLLAMTHEVLEYLGSSTATEEEITRLGKKLNIGSQSFAVRVKRIRHYSKNLSPYRLERFIGDVIMGGEVDLENPGVLIRIFLSENEAVMGKRIFKINRGDFESRNPQMRPFFHPSSLSPVLARALCNICGVVEGKRVLDPFCGTGGLLVEAGILGGKLIGFDIDERMVEGCRTNLAYYGLKGEIKLGNAADLNLGENFDLVITDPPYGRASTTGDMDIDTLYERAAESIFMSLKKMGRACIIAPEKIDILGIMIAKGFKIIEEHSVRVHRSLTRKIVVGEKS